jgi:hypothetical protein
LIYLKNECLFCAFFVYKKEVDNLIKHQEGGKRMKFKPTVMLHGSVLKPLKEGQKAHYCQNGLWHSTSKVMRVLEQTNEHVKFETEAVCYCINFYGDSAGIVTLAA